jgi:hypothetical protein
LAAVRRARRLRPAQEAPVSPSRRQDACSGCCAYREAVVVATRALRRGLDHDDVEARLRVVRGTALAHRSGQPGLRRGAQGGAAGQGAAHARTRPGSAGALRLEGERPRAALAHLAQAEEIYLAADCPLGSLRVLEKRAGVLRGEGRLEEALAVQERRVEVGGRPRAPTCSLSPAAGARPPGRARPMGGGAREFDDSAALFREKGDAREYTVAEAGRAAVDVATGDLGRARARSSACATCTRTAATRGRWRRRSCACRTFTSLRRGRRGRAHRGGGLGLYRLLQDTEGECRSRVRRVHALVTLRRFIEAVREGRRAARAAAASRGDLAAFALLALGRALLRIDSPGGGRGLRAGARAVAQGRPGYVQAADLGIAARAESIPTDTRCARPSPARGLGDRRVLAYALADVREILGRRAAGLVSEGALAALPRVPVLSAAVDAAAPW